MVKKTKRIVTAAAVLALSASVALQYVTLPSFSGGEFSEGNTSSGSNTNLSQKEELGNSLDISGYEQRGETNYNIPSANDLVTVIVKLKGDGMLDFANRYGVNVSQAFSQFSAASELGKYVRLQANTQVALSDVLVKTGYRYNTIFNGFSAQIYYRDLDKIKQNKNVDQVILSNTYAVPETITENYVSVDESTGIFDSSNVGYDGTGTVVAVLDTGTDYTHEVFNMELEESTLALTKDKVAKAVSDGVLAATSLAEKQHLTVNEDDLYLTSKLPYAFDYADSDTNVYSNESHGTHVAGIIAGKSDTITGVATGAQIATFKVFSDYSSGAPTEAILAGLNDAVALGVDAINMSLGSSCGFSREEDDDAINEVYDKVEASGICLVVAASNDYSSGFGSTHGVNLASNPDSGTVGSPASYNAAIAVASVSGVKTKYVIADGNKEIYFTESSKVGSDKRNDFVNGILAGKDSATFEYVVVPGVGLDINYNTLGGTPGKEVEGKIAVVKRGSTNFEDKVRTAQDHGALGVIIYNNISGSISMSVGTKSYIPSCSISMDLGNYLAERGRGTFQVSKDFLAGPFMSDFSSWGVLPNLTLSPDITAHGGEILSSVVGGDDYDKLSGTSMACPNLAGALVLVREYVKNFDTNYTTKEVRDISYSRMMSTATIVRNEEGNPYSPRKQGAGIADMKHSVTTKAYLTVDGSNKPKLSLGHDPKRTGEYTMSFNVVNTSADTLSYDLSSLVFTETMSTDNKTVAEKAYMFNDAKNNFSVSGNASLGKNNVLNVQPNGTAKVTVKVSLTKDNKTYLNNNFRNGMYVEGYICLGSKNADKIDLNIPFLAFYGDWTDAPMLDVSEYEVGESAVDSSVKDEDKLIADVVGTVPFAGFAYNDEYGNTSTSYWGLGAYSFIIPQGYSEPVTRERYAALTSSKDGNYLLYGISAGLLRGAKRTEMEIRDSVTGDLIWSRTSYNGRKACSSGGEPQGGFIDVGFDVSELNLPNNGRYTFNMECFLDWDEGEGYIYGNKNTFSFEFSIDNEAPVLVDYKVREVEYDGITRHYLDMYYYDNHYMQGYVASYFDGTFNEIKDPNNEQTIIPYVIPIYDSEYNGTTRVTLDLTNEWENIAANDYHMILQSYDYCKNESTDYIVLKQETDVKVEKTRTAKDGYTLRPNGQMDLKDYVNVTANVDGDYLEGYWTTDQLVWKSSNPEAVTVKDGLITAGENPSDEITFITVYPRGNDENVIKFNIEVKGEPTAISLSGLKLSVEAVSLERGETLDVSVKVEPHNFKDPIELEWMSTSENVTVTPNANDSFKATIKAAKSGNATVRVSVKGKFISAFCSVNVKEEFNVDGLYLRSYTGRGDEKHVVEIPNDLGIVYIYPGAIFNNPYIEKVIVPEGVQTIMARGIALNKNLKEIVLPTTLTQIQTYGLASNESLTTIVNLGKVRVLGYFALAWSNSLKEVDLSDVTYLATGAFYECPNLASVDLSNIGYVGERAFQLCDALTDVIIPEKTRVGDYAFALCAGLKSVVVKSDYVGDFAFAGCDSLETVTFENNVRKIGAYAFGEDPKLNSVTFHGAVYEIGDMAFNKCTALTTFTLPAGLTNVGSQLFLNTPITTLNIAKDAKLENLSEAFLYGMSSLSKFTVEAGNEYFTAGTDGVLYNKKMTTLVAYPFAKTGNSFTVPNTVKTIGTSAFYGVDTLNRIDFNHSVERIEAYAFAGLEDGKTLAITNYENVTYVGDRAFLAYTVDTKTGAIVFWEHTFTYGYPIGDNIEYIGDYAFAVNKDGRSSTLTLPASLTYLGDGAFSMCNSIVKVVFESDLQYVGEYSFQACESLKNIEFGSLTQIPYAMFAECTALKSIDLRETNVTEIGESAFMGCSDLTSAYLPEGMSKIPAGLFAQSGLASFELSESVTEIGDGAFYATNLKEFDFKNVTSVGAQAFAGTSEAIGGLKEVSSSLITFVDELAFAYTDVRTVNLPALKELGMAAFMNCTSLIDAQMPYLEKIGDGAFFGCSELATIYLDLVKEIGEEVFENATLLEDISLESVEKIGALAFAGTRLTQINLPASLQSVDELAFYGAEKLEAIQVNDACEKYFSKEGVLYFKNANGYFTLVNYPSGRQDKSYTAIDRTLKVGAYAFAGNSYVEEITLPPHLQIIGACAFAETDGLKILNLRSVFAPRLESYSRKEDKEILSFVYDDDGNEVWETVDGVTRRKTTSETIKIDVNRYWNFKTMLYVAGANEDEEDKTGAMPVSSFGGLTVIVPKNMTEYDNFIWQRYVGAILDQSEVNEPSKVAFEFMDRVTVLHNKQITKADGDELKALQIMYNMFDDIQKAYVVNYDGVNYYSWLQEAQEAYDNLPDETETEGLPAWAWALIGIAIAAVVAGAGVGVFFFIKLKKKPQDGTQELEKDAQADNSETAAEEPQETDGETDDKN